MRLEVLDLLQDREALVGSFMWWGSSLGRLLEGSGNSWKKWKAAGGPCNHSQSDFCSSEQNSSVHFSNIFF